MKDLLNQLTKQTLNDEDQSIWCPFHKDAVGGHQSAKYYHGDNSIYCWSCGRTYRPFDALKFMGYSDEDIKKCVKGAVDTTYDLEVAVKSVKDRKKQKTLFSKDQKESVDQMKRQFVAGNVPLTEYVHGLMELI